MADIPREKNDSVFNQTIRENFTRFSELDFKNASDNSHIIDIKGDVLLDIYTNSSNVLVIVADTTDAVNKLKNSNDDVMYGLRNRKSILNEEMQNDTNLNISIWNTYRVSFKMVITFLEN